MAKLLAFLVLSLSSLSLWAGGSVAVIPNAPAFKAILTGVSCPWATSAMASAAACFAQWKRSADETVGGAGVSCWLQIRNSLTGSDDQPQVLRRQTVTVRQSPPMLPGERCDTAGQVTESAFPIEVWRANRALCPANATGNVSESPTACYCNSGYKPNAGATACVADCTANQTVSSGWYDIGESQGGRPQLLGCKGLCEVVFDGTSPAGSAMVEGKKHWYAKGEYIATGGTCPAAMADKPIGDGTPTKPEDTCAPGEAKGTVNGKAVCVKQAGDDAGKPTDESATKDKTTTETKTETNPDGSVTTTETTVKIGADGKKETTIKKTTTNPDGSTSSGSETVTEWPPAGSDGGSEDGEEGEEETPCQKNPSGEGCGGDPVPITSLYTGKDKTITGVLTTHANALKSGGLGGLVSGFFSVSAGGGCPTFSRSIPFLETTLTIDQFCTDFANQAFAIFRIALLVAASFFAFRIALE